MDAQSKTNLLTLSNSPQPSTLPSVASDRTFLDVLRSEDFESWRVSTHGQTRRHAAKVSADSPSSTRAKNVKHRKALKRTELTKHTTRQNYGGSPSPVKQQTSDKPSDRHRLAYSACISKTGFSANVPAAKSPIFHLPCMPVIIDHYVRRLAVALPELDGPHDKNLLLKVWFPFVLHSPTVFQIAMLFSAAHFASYFPNNLHAETLLYLKQCALTGLVKLVSTGSTSDETTAAVVNMASFEALFGSTHNYHIHMQALQRILRMRGGIAKLGLNGFLARLVVFIDAHSAHVLNTDVYLDGSTTTTPRQEPFNCENSARFRRGC